MRVSVVRVVVARAACWLPLALSVALSASLLSGCESANKTIAGLTGGPLASPTASSPDAEPGAQAQIGSQAALSPQDAGPDATATIAATGQAEPLAEPLDPPEGSARLAPYDDLTMGKREFSQNNFGLAEQYFRRAVEKGSTDKTRTIEAWIGLAASYDRLHRYELADRAYAQALKIAGRMPEILNNQGFSYMLRGDYRRARVLLREAGAKDPDNPNIRANLKLLEQNTRR
jgi:Flp pilus assembly protein TadD